jgi:RNA polymerase sigma factor (TIGR02999 family)
MTAIDDPDLFVVLYQDLKVRAKKLRQPGATLDTTALVHEAWLKLHVNGQPTSSLEHMFRTAALAMRHILLDHVRAQSAQKRSPSPIESTPEHEQPGLEHSAICDALDLVRSLEFLRQVDARKADVVEWHVLAGIALVDIANALNISVPTAKRDLRAGRAMLASARTKR